MTIPMCEPGQIAAYIRSALRLNEGRRLFVVEADNGDGFVLEAIIADDETISPEAALQEFCQSSGREAAGRRCLPVVVADGFDMGGNEFRLVRDDDHYIVEPR